MARHHNGEIPAAIRFSVSIRCTHGQTTTTPEGCCRPTCVFFWNRSGSTAFVGGVGWSHPPIMLLSPNPSTLLLSPEAPLLDTPLPLAGCTDTSSTSKTRVAPPGILGGEPAWYDRQSRRKTADHHKNPIRHAAVLRWWTCLLARTLKENGEFLRTAP